MSNRSKSRQTAPGNSIGKIDRDEVRDGVWGGWRGAGVQHAILKNAFRQAYPVTQLSSDCATAHLDTPISRLGLPLRPVLPLRTGDLGRCPLVGL